MSEDRSDSAGNSPDHSCYSSRDIEILHWMEMRFRFLTEFIRPEPEWLPGLTFYQWAALVLAAALTLQWVAEERRHAGIGSGFCLTSVFGSE